MEITLTNLKKTYNLNTVLHVDNFTIPSGQFLGIVGNNGAGKTTLFKCMLDLTEPTEGYVLSNGIKVGEREDWKFYTAAYLNQEFLIDFFTPWEYFSFIGNLNHVNSKDVDDFLSEFSDFMNDEIMNQNKLIRNFSSGNKQKIGIIGAFIASPKVLILDEPFNHLDPSSQLKLKDILKKYNQKSNATIIISSHILEHVVDICQSIALMERGSIIKYIQSVNQTTLSDLKKYFEE